MMPEWAGIPAGIVIMVIGGYFSIRSMFNESIWRLVAGIGLVFVGLAVVSVGVVYTLDTYGTEYTCVEVTE
jgi:hypothetical protein